MRVVSTASAEARVAGAHPGAARAAAGALALLVPGGVVAGVFLHAATGDQPLTRGVTTWWLMQATAAVSFGGTGAWLAAQRPRLVVGWILLGVGVVQALTFVAIEYGVRTLVAGEVGGTGGLALWASTWGWSASLVVVAAVLPMLLPDGRLPSPAWRPALLLASTAVVTQSLWWSLAPYEAWAPDLAAAGATNPVAVPAVAQPAVQVPVNLLAVGAVLAGVAALITRWRASRGVLRDQLKWILYGLALALLLFAAGFALGPYVTALAMVPLPLACLVAAERHGMWDVDRVISRSLVYGLLTVAVLAVFVATVTVMGGLLGRTTGAPIVGTALVAVLVEPLLRRLRTLVNRLVYGEREDPYAVLSRLGARLEATQDESAVTERLLPDVAAAVAGSLRLPYAALELADGSLVEHGTATSRLEAMPLTYGDHDVGRLVVGIGVRGLGRRESRALGDLAGQAAVAAHTVLLTRDLHRSREALVSAREEERRRLYRDLHDGLGPSLAALALQVETARDLVGDDPGRAAGVLDRALPRLKDVVGDVREVVTGLRPPALDDLGLEGALRELVARFASGTTTVDLGTDPLGDLPAAVEVAAYRITAEALTNAARHSGASRVLVRLERRPDALLLRVEDDGHGFEQPERRGVGLESMRARASELGGTCTITSGPARRGTVVAVCLPTGGVAT